MTENTTASGAADLPEFPGHPEPHNMMWSALEIVAIKKYGADMFRAGRLAASAPVAPTQPDWRELCRRLYVELFHCDKQMTCSLNEDGEPTWRTGPEVCDVLSDAKAALEANPITPEAAPVAPAPQPAVPKKKPLPDLMMAAYHEAIGWNACVDAMNVTAVPKAAPQPSPTAGMNMVQRDLPRHQCRRLPDHEIVTMYAECPSSDAEMLDFAHELMDAMLAPTLPAEQVATTDVAEDAANWHWLASYLVGPRTDLDDEIVASESVNDLRKLVSAARAQAAQPEGGANANR